MRARESFYGDSELERVRAEIRRARRAEVVWTVLTVLTLLGLVALVYWLLWLCPRNFSGTVSSFKFQVLGSGLAMAPVMSGSILGLLAFFTLVLTYLAVRKVEADAAAEKGLREHRLTELVDPFTSCTDGLTGDEMHRILVSVAAESREVRRIVVRLDPDDDARREEQIGVAAQKISALIRCVEALCERLQPEITEGGN